MIYGYARVSTNAQDVPNQLEQLKAAECDSIFREKITGGFGGLTSLLHCRNELNPQEHVATQTYRLKDGAIGNEVLLSWE